MPDPICDNETGRGEQLSSVQFSSTEAWWSLASEGLVFLVNNEWKWSPTHFDSSIRYNSVARRPRDRLMIMAAEKQGVLERKLFSIKLKPQIFIRFSRSRGKVGAGLCHWADQGGLLLGGAVQGKARAAA